MILESLKQLGGLKTTPSESLDNFIEPLNKGAKNPTYLIFLILTKKEGIYKIDKIDYAEHSSVDNKKWLYRRDKSNRNPFSPTIKLNHKKLLDKKNGTKKKEITQIKRRWGVLFKNIDTNLSKIIPEIDMNKVISILEKIEDKKATYFLSIKINGKLPYDIASFKDYFKKRVLGDESCKVREQGTCFICNKEDFVDGEYSPFGYYNKDKPGFFSNLEKENIVFAFPICNSCKNKIESGKRLLESSECHLSHTCLNEVKYFILPISIKGTLKGFFIKIKDYSKTLGALSLLSTSQKRDEKEQDLLDFLADQENDMSFSIFFYTVPQGRSFKILKTIEQRLPSDFKRVSNAKKAVEASSFFREIRKENKKVYFDGYFISEILEDNEGNIDSKIVLSLYSTILHLKEPDFLEKIIENKIKNTYLQILKDNNKSSEDRIKKVALYLLVLKYFFKNLINMEGTIMPNIDDLDSFVKENFGKDTLRAAFILGMMVQLLLKTQRQARGSEPFLNRLNEFRISNKKIKELAPEVINKLKWYSLEDTENCKKINDKMQMLNSELGKYAINIDKESYNNITEISFAFIIGMGLLNQLGGN